MKIFILIILSVLFTITNSQAENWLQFRGSNSNGSTNEIEIPSKLKQIAWSVKLDSKGASGPIVVGNKVFITSCTGFLQDRLHIVCFNTESGKIDWERQFWATGKTGCHEKISVATPTPASDGERIVASYSSNDVACFDLEGNLLWYRGLGKDFPDASNSLGMSSSPVIVEGIAVFQVEAEPDAYAIGLDMKTGKTVWKIERPRHANWASPSIMRGEQDLVILPSLKGIAAIDPRTGYTVWKSLDSGSSVTSVTTWNNHIFVPVDGIKVLNVSAPSTTPELLWEKGNISASTASPVVYENKIYTINGAGVLKSSSAENGKINWQLRLSGGRCSSSPIIAGDHLFVANEKGTLFSVDLSGKKGKIVGTQKLDEMILGTPALSSGAIYLRSNDHLWKITN